MDPEIALHNCIVELERNCKRWCKKLKRSHPEVLSAKPHAFKNDLGGVSCEILITGSFEDEHYVGYRVRRKS